MTLRDVSFPAFCRAVGLRLFPWQADAFGRAVERRGGRFVHRLAGISVPRGNGKSFGGAAVGVWRLTTGPGRQDIISAALDTDGARVVLDHARAIVRASPVLDRMVDVRANSLHVPSTGSRWTVTSREHTASRGRHPTLVLYDELGFARDTELFTSLLAGQASVEDPLMLVVSTVGRRDAGPLSTVKQLAEGGDPAVFWYWSGENLSPKVTAEFLDRRRRILMPGQFAREHQNRWVDGADAFVVAADLDAAMGGGHTEERRGRLDVEAVAFVDIGTVHDPSVIAVGYEANGRFYVGRLLTFQGTREHPVQLADVERALVSLSDEWRLVRVRIESWQGVSAAQTLERVGLPVELFTPTAKSNAEEWPVLGHALSDRKLALFPHTRLREELLNLVYEVGASGMRVIDRGKVHQDHAVAVRGVVAMLKARQTAWNSEELQAVLRMGGVGGALTPTNPELAAMRTPGSRRHDEDARGEWITEF